MDPSVVLTGTTRDLGGDNIERPKVACCAKSMIASLLDAVPAPSSAAPVPKSSGLVPKSHQTSNSAGRKNYFDGA